MMRRLLLGGGLLLVLLGGGQSGYIAAKAWLAEGLIASAWSQSKLTGAAIPPWPWADTHPVARLRVARLEVDQLVLAGMSGRSIAFAPGLAMAGAQPGQFGTILISGHRDTHLGFVAKLEAGDLIEVEDRGGDWRRYRVAGHQIIDGDTRIALDAGEDLLLLATCYPFTGITGNARQRIVITALPA